MQKMWKQLGSESWGFESPEVTKGFHPGSVGRGGRRRSSDSDASALRGTKTASLTGLPFRDRQARYTTQTPSERGMRSAGNEDRASSGKGSGRRMDVLESLNGMLIKDLGRGRRCKDHLNLHNVPLERSVVSTREPPPPCKRWTL